MGFRSELAQSLHLAKTTDDDVEYCVDIVASAVTNECLVLKVVWSQPTDQQVALREQTFDL